MGTYAKVECRLCGSMATIRSLREHHGPTKPGCIGRKWWSRMEVDGLRFAEQYEAVIDLALAGFGKRFPRYAWWREPVYGPPDDDTGEVHVEEYRLVELVEFPLAVEEWLYEMAKRLTLDTDLARRLGFTQKKELKLVKRPVVKRFHGKRVTAPPDIVDKVWVPCDKDRVLPIELRAKILRVAIHNEVAREMIIDDPEAAGQIILGYA